MGCQASPLAACGLDIHCCANRLATPRPLSCLEPLELGDQTEAGDKEDAAEVENEEPEPAADQLNVRQFLLFGSHTVVLLILSIGGIAGFGRRCGWL